MRITSFQAPEVGDLEDRDQYLLDDHRLLNDTSSIDIVGVIVLITSQTVEYAIVNLDVRGVIEHGEQRKVNESNNAVHGIICTATH